MTVKQQKNKKIQNSKGDFNSIEDLYKWGEELAWTALGFKPDEK
jgi:hypothetical protein